MQHASSPAPAQTTRLQNARQHQLHQTVRLHRAPTRFTRNTPRNACQEFHLVENTRTFVHSHSCRHPAAAASSLLLPAPHFTTPAAVTDAGLTPENYLCTRKKYLLWCVGAPGSVVVPSSNGIGPPRCFPPSSNPHFLLLGNTWADNLERSKNPHSALSPSLSQPPLSFSPSPSHPASPLSWPALSLGSSLLFTSRLPRPH